MPNVGKSTLFNALTRASAAVANYPFCTIEPNVGIVPVQDARLTRLAGIVGVDNVIHSTVEYVDVAGLVKGASEGAGRGNEFLEAVRGCQALEHVVRCFEDPDVAHVTGTLDPVSDIETINAELVLADLQMVDGLVSRLRKQTRNEKDLKPTVAVLERLLEALSGGTPVREVPLSADDDAHLRSYRFVTDKKVLYVANVDEGALPSGTSDAHRTVAAFAESHGSACVPVTAKLEAEIADLPEDEAGVFMEELGLTETGLARVVGETSRLLGLANFFTFNEEQARSWVIRQGDTAPTAAGKIHTDMRDGFIRAEVMTYADLDRLGSERRAREEGLVRTEGKDYVVQDGDIILFKFAKPA